MTNALFLWTILLITYTVQLQVQVVAFPDHDDDRGRFLSVFAITPGGRPQTNPYEYQRPQQQHPSRERCATRLESALDQIKRRQMLKARDLETPVQLIDFDGYSIHQHLRSAPMDMYVTRMRVRLPQTQNWVRIERCHFDPRNTSLETRLLFNDLTISGNVNLRTEQNELERADDDVYDRFYDRDYNRRNRRYSYENDRKDTINNRDRNRHESRRGDCNMILRLRKAGIGFFTQPLNQSPGQFNVKTDSEFIEPGFISVYAYGCEKYVSRKHYDDDREFDDYRDKNHLDKRQKRETDKFHFESRMNDDLYRDYDRDDTNYRMEKSKLFGPEDHLEDFDTSREMEDIFTKGIRTLLTTYMQKELQPAIKETLMRNLGYTISYGK